MVSMQNSVRNNHPFLYLHKFEYKFEVKAVRLLNKYNASWVASCLNLNTINIWQKIKLSSKGALWNHSGSERTSRKWKRKWKMKMLLSQTWFILFMAISNKCRLIKTCSNFLSFKSLMYLFDPNFSWNKTCKKSTYKMLLCS